MITHFSRAIRLASLLLLGACASQSTSYSDPELVDNARKALHQLYAAEPKAAAIQDAAKAVLVFPEILKAGFMVGAQGGRGVMFDQKGKVLGYYRATALSFGMQAGAQAFSEALFLITDDAIRYINSTGEWSIGVGPSVVVVEAGAAKSLTTTTTKSDVYAFIYGQQGLMAGIGVQGQRIRRLDQ
ncbi:YSC84-related protein [Bordetella bronchialis]|uniref:Twin-arginine translocation pathway signal protein n=1 Tax=Bordetella bronchialis TaxID=463025 RepID=A0A193FYP2_9BORD|nr:YSC84-related protein [Bordetella bronchialis]ANN67226.1 twin-arginine translocation pathway signal protein [Bordetella bronchialis]ANN72306.1 twin-arginine translocation pathway signal protein [Bordetella bronchialis]